MSRVTNIMVAALFVDLDNVDAFAEWLREHPQEYGEGYRWEAFGPGDELPYIGDLQESPKEAWPGPGRANCYVWLGVLDHANLSVVREHFAGISWDAPDAVQLFLRDQGEAFFRLWMIRAGKLCQYAPLEPDETNPRFFS